MLEICWHFLNNPDRLIYKSIEEAHKTGVVMRIPEKRLEEQNVSKIRVLELENCVIMMCEKCGEIWNPHALNSCACPNGCNRVLDR